MNYFSRLTGVLLATLLLANCTLPLPIGQAPTATPAPTAIPTLAPSATPAPSNTPLPTSTPTATPTVTPTPQPTDPPLTPTATLTALGAEQRQAVFERTWELVRDRYVYSDYRGLDWEAIRAEFEPKIAAASDADSFYGLMRELIDRLNDEHSRFETPQDVAASEAEFDGDLKYGGIGAMVRSGDDGGVITRLVADGPAAQAGLQPGDVITAVNGIPFTDTARFGASGPVGRVRGDPGTIVQLTVRSPGGQPRVVDVTRRVIPSDAFPEVEAQLLPGTRVGLLLLGTFYLDDLDGLVRDKLGELARDGPLDGLIIDIRDNGGGRLDLLFNTLALFIDGGSIGSTSGRNGRNERELVVDDGQTLEAYRGVPIVVLTSEDTASAGEMFAAGMQVTKRARVVGTASAGNVENLIGHDLPDGSRLWLAERAYRLPDGTLIEERGVQPDRTVDVEWWRYSTTDDPQIKAALEEL